jgi:hypothetical protein
MSSSISKEDSKWIWRIYRPQTDKDLTEFFTWLAGKGGDEETAKVMVALLGYLVLYRGEAYKPLPVSPQSKVVEE